MKKPVQMVIVLGLVGFLSGTSLVLVYRYATPLIKSNQKRALEAAIFKVVSGGTRYEVMTKDGERFFKVYDKRDKLLGYAFIAEGSGYQGKIEMISAIKKDLSTLYGVEILESVETPGLGGEIVSDEFRDQFTNLKFDPKIECVKKDKKKKNEIEAITGATISSQSVTNILNEKIAKLVETLKK
ncbi:FMN-binding protein [Omnitrophica bacterium]|nr:FMN-binding protein [Candidatus Omnitrophota bacterium]